MTPRWIGSHRQTNSVHLASSIDTTRKLDDRYVFHALWSPTNRLWPIQTLSIVSIEWHPYRHGSQGLTGYFSASHQPCNRGMVHSTVDSADRSIEFDNGSTSPWCTFCCGKGVDQAVNSLDPPLFQSLWIFFFFTFCRLTQQIDRMGQIKNESPMPDRNQASSQKGQTGPWRTCLTVPDVRSPTWVSRILYKNKLFIYKKGNLPSSLKVKKCIKKGY